jgi:invasion protein IalB
MGIKQKVFSMLALLFVLSAPLYGVLIADVMAETDDKKPALEETEGKQFKDWILKCGGEGLKDDKCYIVQNIFIQESGLRILGVAAGYLGPDDSPWLFFTMPLGIFLPTGMVFNIDDGEEIKPPIRICLPDGCKASIKLEGKLLNALKKGNKAKVAFLDGNTQKQITVEVSLKGFSRGFVAL